MSMETIIKVLAYAACKGFGVKLWSQGTHGSSQTLMVDPSPIRYHAPLVIDFFAPSMALQIGDAFERGLSHS